MKSVRAQRPPGAHRLGRAFAVLLLLLCLRGMAAISEGPKPENPVAAQQREKLLFDQAILSNQEKLRVGQERYEQRQAERARVVQAMTAQLQSRQQVVALQPASAAPILALEPGQWLRPLLTFFLVMVVLVSARFLYLSRKREQAAADREKLF
jgi:hypothetical protein